MLPALTRPASSRKRQKAPAASVGSDRVGVLGRFVVAAVAAVDVADRDRGELFGREVERRHGDGMESATQRLELAAREGADAAGPTEREGEVRFGFVARRPAVLRDPRLSARQK